MICDLFPHPSFFVIARLAYKNEKKLVGAVSRSNLKILNKIADAR
jgi:hypothetical protein